jgi:hypothetical protein
LSFCDFNRQSRASPASGLNHGLLIGRNRNVRYPLVALSKEEKSAGLNDPDLRVGLSDEMVIKRLSRLITWRI